MRLFILLLVIITPSYCFSQLDLVRLGDFVLVDKEDIVKLMNSKGYYASDKFSTDSSTVYRFQSTKPVSVITFDYYRSGKVLEFVIANEMEGQKAMFDQVLATDHWSFVSLNPFDEALRTFHERQVLKGGKNISIRMETCWDCEDGFVMLWFVKQQ